MFEQLKPYLGDKENKLEFYNGIIYGLALGLLANYIITVIFQEVINDLDESTKYITHFVVIIIFISLLVFIYKDTKKNQLKLNQAKKVFNASVASTGV